MHNFTSPGRLNGRRVVPAAAAALAAVALAAPAANAQTTSPISVDVAQDSVLVTGLPFGQAKLQITRPDIRTGTPVVIGEVSGFALFGFPFGANTTAPTLLNPLGDCWQKGVLALANNAGLTPDILPGDTATVVGGPTYTVPDGTPLSNGSPGGPISGCEALSLFGKNIVTDAQFSSPGSSDLAVTGHAQPGAQAVSVSVKDANGVASEPVDATLAADGSYTATVPAAKLAGLANGQVTVVGDYDIPDVAAGTRAHIGGQTMDVDKQFPATPPRFDPPASDPAPAPAAKIALSGLFMRSAITAKSVSAGKLRVSFITPSGAQYVRVRLWRPGQTAAVNIVAAGTPGTRQTVALTGAKASKLKKGKSYTVTVSASPLKTMFVGPSLRGKVRIR